MSVCPNRTISKFLCLSQARRGTFMSEAKTAADAGERNYETKPPGPLFSARTEKGCSRRRIASFAISLSTASADAEGADYEGLSFAFSSPIILHRREGTAGNPAFFL